MLVTIFLLHFFIFNILQWLQRFLRKAQTHKKVTKRPQRQNKAAQRERLCKPLGKNAISKYFKRKDPHITKVCLFYSIQFAQESLTFNCGTCMYKMLGCLIVNKIMPLQIRHTCRWHKLAQNN